MQGAVIKATGFRELRDERGPGTFHVGGETTERRRVSGIVINTEEQGGRAGGRSGTAKDKVGAQH